MDVYSRKEISNVGCCRDGVSLPCPLKAQRHWCPDVGLAMIGLLSGQQAQQRVVHKEVTWAKEAGNCRVGGYRKPVLGSQAGHVSLLTHVDTDK